MANIVCPQCHRIVDEGTRSCPGCKFNIKKYVKDMKKNGGSFNSTISLGSVYNHNDDSSLPELDFLKNPPVSEPAPAPEPAPQPVQAEIPAAAPVVAEAPVQEAPQEYTIMQGNVQPAQTYGTAPVQAPVSTSTQEYTITPGNAQPTQSHAIPQAATTVSGQSSLSSSRFAYKPRTAAAAPEYDPNYKAKQAELAAAEAEQPVVAETPVMEPVQEAYAAPATQPTEQPSLYAAPAAPAQPAAQPSLYAAPAQSAAQPSLYAAPAQSAAQPSLYAAPAQPAAQPSLYAAPAAPQTDPGAPASLYGTAPAQSAAPQTDPGAPASLYGTAPAQSAAPQIDPGAPASLYGTAPAAPAQPAAPQTDPGAPASLYGTAPSKNDSGIKANLYTLDKTEQHTEVGVHAGIGGSSSRTVIEKLGGMEEKKESNLILVDPTQNNGPVFESPLLNQTVVKSGGGALTGTSKMSIMEKIRQEEMAREEALNSVFESPNLRKAEKNIQSGAGAAGGALSNMGDMSFDFGNPEEDNIFKTQKYKIGAGGDEQRQQQAMDKALQEALKEAQRMEQGRILPQPGVVSPQPSMPAGSSMYGTAPAAPGGSPMYGTAPAQPAAPAGNPLYGQPAAPSGNPLYGQPAQNNQGAGSSVVNFNPAYGMPGQTPAGGANPFLGGGQ